MATNTSSCEAKLTESLIDVCMEGRDRRLALAGLMAELAAQGATPAEIVAAFFDQFESLTVAEFGDIARLAGLVANDGERVHSGGQI